MANDSEALGELFATSTLGSPDRAIGFVLWRVLHRYVRESERVLVDVDLTHLQFQTLALTAWLGRGGDPVTQSDLARAGDIAPMQVSHMMKTLERKGLIRRATSATDVRAKEIEVTATGIDALRQAFPAMIRLQEDMFGADGSPGGPLLEALRRAESVPGA